MPEQRMSAGRPLVGGVGISNPQRVIDKVSGATKLALAEYYQAVADRLVPQLAGRPLSIVRAPEGVDGESFFQRHCGRLQRPHMRALQKNLDPEHARLIQADNITAVIEAVQMGTVEFHTWNARSDRVERPDRVIFDLDPDPALPWSSMVEATELTLQLLDDLGLQAFLKTSGGRGMHVVVPLDRRHDWDLARQFARSRGAGADRRQNGAAESGRANFRRLPAQPARGEHRCRLFGQGASGAGGIRACRA